MNKEEQKILKQQFEEEKERIFAAEPEVRNWIHTKKIIFRGIAIFWIVHAILSIVALLQMGSGFHFMMDVLRPLFQLFWLYIFISPNGTWRVNAVIYFWALYNLVMNFNNYIQNLQGYLSEMIQQMPILGAVFGMELLVPFLFLGVACYLTIPKSHRELSERAQNIQQELMASFKAMGGNS